MVELKPKELKTSKMEGFSEKQLEDHHGVLYKGYVNKVNEIRKQMASVDYDKANQTYSELRALKIEETFALNGIKLHEAYFENMGGSGGKATGKALELIEKYFGSYEAWEKDFKKTGLAVRGWVVLAYDLEDGTLHNFGSDSHNLGPIWNAVPVLVLDTYEHAYMIDYGVKRPPYIDAFMNVIDWDVVNARLAKIEGARTTEVF
ncbi:superoxide dismutase [Dethiobacter alkaliphilus]|uniref:superoxide dismutase n=1 Tax=Dethiobacter alkaliphilus AHT 1 TaxID=555088 RepID=C0GKM5_DETAL|nr:superoxide dismutase [Dethiobacter alkaliphilus]EEG76117.1 Superoxide dismutase [Dethiobacter alkaliphilus AHT 1]MCW3489613.1 superoxide dismutase [Dethiobacter alkaliphilus]